MMHHYCGGSLTTWFLFFAVLSCVGVLIAPSPPQLSHETPKCPSPCRCDSIARVLNCSDASLKQIPKILGSRSDYEIFIVERNSLMTVENDSFIGFSSLLTLSLADNNISTVENNSLQNLNQLDKLDLSRNNLYLVPWAALQLSTLRELHLRDNGIYILRASDIKGLRALKKIFLDSNMIGHLPDGFLEHASDLNVLSMTRNRLETIGSKVFRCAESLRELYLAENSLRDLPNGWLTGASNLSVLDMTRSMYIINEPNEDVPAYTFPGVAPGLETLILAGNGIRDLKPLAFSPLQGLKELDLSQNVLRSLPRGCFSPNMALEYVNLKSNNIYAFAQQLFSEDTGTRMVELNLEDNKIEIITKNAFSNMLNLEILNLASNNILEIESLLFSELRELKKLFLQNNVITNITYYSFSFIFSIEELHLQNNRLKRVPNVANLTNLDKLDLAGNEIEYVPPNAFEGTSITRLNLRRNDLKTLPESINDLQLTTLYVGKNPWHCDCKISWIPKAYNNLHFLNDLEDANCKWPISMQATNLAADNLNGLKCNGTITPTSIVILVSLWLTVLLILVLSVVLRQYHKYRVKTRRRGDKRPEDIESTSEKSRSGYLCDESEIDLKTSNGRLNGMKIKPFEEEFYV